MTNEEITAAFDTVRTVEEEVAVELAAMEADRKAKLLAIIARYPESGQTALGYQCAKGMLETMANNWQFPTLMSQHGLTA